MPIDQLKRILEAALLAASQPLTLTQLCELFTEEDQVDREAIARALESLMQDAEGRGVALLEVASGFRYQVRGEVHPWVARMWTEKPSRYSRALLETLALIAYRQPITRPEIEQIRGVVVSSNIIKTLEEREWIRVVGHRDVPGKPALFGTTRAFLDYFNLKSLDALPPLSEIRDLEDPQLKFEPEPLPAYVPRDLPIDPDAEATEEAQATENGSGADATPGTSEAEHPSPTVDDMPESPPSADEAPTPVDVDVEYATEHVIEPEPDHPAPDGAAAPATAAEAANPVDAARPPQLKNTEEPSA